MKKPNITKGEWRWIVHDHSMASLVGEDEAYDHVLSVSPCPNCQREGESPFNRCTMPNDVDAKAISAVPDMIDALIDMKTFIKNGIEFGYICLPEEGDSALDTIAKIDKALIKAGVEGL